MITLSVLILLIMSCTSTTEPDDEIKIKGQVTDSSGDPVSEAKIMLTYNTESINSRPLMPISFNLTSPSSVKIWITQHNEQDTLKILVDEFVDSGNHVCYWNGKNYNEIYVVSNFYDYHISINDNQIDNKTLLNMEYFNVTGDDLNNYTSFALTDDNGNYDFKVDKLPFSFSDNEIEITDENGVVIDIVRVSRIVKIWALHTDYDPVYIDSVYVNEGSKTVGNLSFD